jgi:hypothetical protein
MIEEPKSKTTVPLIPVKETVRTAWQMSKAEWRPIFKIVAMPYLLLATCELMIHQPADISSGPPDLHLMFDMMLSIVPALVLIFIASNLITPWAQVAGLRYLVLGEKSEVWWPNYSSRMWRYLWKKWVVAFVLIFPIGLCGGLLFALLPKIFAGASSLAVLLAAIIASTRIYLAVTASAIQDDTSLKTAWHRTRGQILNISAIGFFAALRLFFPFLLVFGLSALIEFLVGHSFHPIIHCVNTWCMSVLALIVFLPINTLLYAHFYQEERAPPAQVDGAVGVG